jgi:hypothetical protein
MTAFFGTLKQCFHQIDLRRELKLRRIKAQLRQLIRTRQAVTHEGVDLRRHAQSP